MRTLGIDPGLQGGIALIEDGKFCWRASTPVIAVAKSRKVPDETAMVEFLKRAKPDLVIIEKAQPMVRKDKSGKLVSQGAVGMFRYGMAYGIWLGIIAAFGIRHERVSPRRWKNQMIVDIPGDNKKAQAMIAAKRLFPDIGKILKTHHHQAEAILMAAYGELRYGKEPGQSKGSSE